MSGFIIQNQRVGTTPPFVLPERESTRGPNSGDPSQTNPLSGQSVFGNLGTDDLVNIGVMAASQILKLDATTTMLITAGVKQLLGDTPRSAGADASTGSPSPAASVVPEGTNPNANQVLVATGDTNNNGGNPDPSTSSDPDTNSGGASSSGTDGQPTDAELLQDDTVLVDYGNANGQFSIQKAAQTATNQMAAIDTNGNGIEQTELVAFYRAQGMTEQEAVAQTAMDFRGYDVRRNGQADNIIDRNELVAKMMIEDNPYLAYSQMSQDPLVGATAQQYANLVQSQGGFSADGRSNVTINGRPVFTTNGQVTSGEMTFASMVAAENPDLTNATAQTYVDNIVAPNLD
ncbi:MAG: hypothetical protein SFZ03_02350 [Candidatus Melainabacteria bacterium]|nr:hypothetical protein [Candidatus Melainabacteria bacterium]